MRELGLSSAPAYKEHVKYTSTANWSMTATHCNMPHFVARPCLEMYWQSDTRVSTRAGKNLRRAEQSLRCSRQVLSACSASTSKQWRRGESFSVGGPDFYRRCFRGHISSSSGKLCQHVLQPAETNFAPCCNAQMFMFSCCCSF